MAEPQTVFILALDTTTRGGSVAVLDDDRLLALVPGDAGRSHAERLPAELEAALTVAAVDRTAIDLLVVATGPGAFTGLRIGLAAMQGLAMTLNRPVIGVSALDALAAEALPSGASFLAPWMDAQRGEVFATLLAARDGQTLETPIAAPPGDVLAAFRVHIGAESAVFIGDAVARDADLIANAGTGRWTTMAPPQLAPALGRIGRQRLASGGTGLPHQLSPIYVRRPDVEIERDRRSQTPP